MNKPALISAVGKQALSWLLLSIAMITGLLLQGCATPYIQPSLSTNTIPGLYDTYAIMDDGYRLPLTRWKAHGDSKAIVLALHGLNDYRHGFESVGQYLSARGISVIAYDQRGFGESTGHGLWHGSERMTKDLVAMAELVQKAYPGKPFYLLGESMGGAVVLAAQNKGSLDSDGSILVAPAIWARSTMPFYQRWALWLAAHTMPSRELTGEGLDLHPSDNIEMLRALGRDPLVIKSTRIDVLYGVANLMDLAADTRRKIVKPTLILYGRNDDIIPRKPTCQWLQTLPIDHASRLQVVIYANGYHMLTRDIQADIVLGDIAAWIDAPDATVPKHTGIIPIGEFCDMVQTSAS